MLGGGAWWGRNAVKFKKRNLWGIFWGGGFLGKSKKRCGKTFGGKKNCLGGQLLEKFQKKKFEGEFYFGGRVVGEECWEIKKKLWKFFFGGGGILGGHWGEKIWGPL